jgi:cell division septation protein DedD
MKDKQMSEKDIFEDLDKMYQRVADVEKEEAAEASVHKKEKPKPRKKPPSRSKLPMIIVALIACIILVGIFAFPFLKQTIAPLLPKTSKTPPPIVFTPPAPKAKPPAPLPIPKEQEVAKALPEVVEKPKPVPQKITKLSKSLPREEFYTIQIGAFHDLENARDLLENLKRDGLDAYFTRLDTKKGGILYKVFVGHFTDKKEAAQFFKEKKILNDYPGSFVRKGPSFKIHQLSG